MDDIQFCMATVPNDASCINTLHKRYMMCMAQSLMQHIRDETEVLSVLLQFLSLSKAVFYCLNTIIRVLLLSALPQ